MILYWLNCHEWVVYPLFRHTQLLLITLFVYLGIGWHASVCFLNSFNLWVRFPSHSYFCCNCGGGMWWLSCILKRFNCPSSTTLASTAALQTPRSPGFQTRPEDVPQVCSSENIEHAAAIVGRTADIAGIPILWWFRAAGHFDNIKMVQTCSKYWSHFGDAVFIFFDTTIKCYPVGAASKILNLGASWRHELSFPSAW